MKRDLAHLAAQPFDLLVVGAGIYGACIAWDGALRGLSVALVDQGDFGHATSANSLKTIHGGLRYLQDGNPALMRAMIAERSTWLRIAPHLVHPLPVLMPTTARPTRSRPVLAAALALTDLVGSDRNRHLPADKRLPNGHLISKARCLQLLPGIASEGITGGALWHDAQVRNSERLTLAVVRAAVEAGACVANYVEAAELQIDQDRVAGVLARDVLSGHSFAIRARMVVDAAGPWAQRLLASGGRTQERPIFHPSLALNLVTRLIIPGIAAGVPGFSLAQTAGSSNRQEKGLFFIVPWRGRSIVGTEHLPCEDPIGDLMVTGAMVQAFLDGVNRAYPGAGLGLADIHLVHRGILPSHRSADGRIRLIREGQVVDHRSHGIEGLVSVVSVKYTTARRVAEQVVDHAVKRLNRPAPACRTRSTLLWGGPPGRYDVYRAQAVSGGQPGVRSEVLGDLVDNYGTQYRRVLELLAEDPSWGAEVSPGTGVIGAQVIYGVREEMARTLADVVLRRTPLGSAGHPGLEALESCASLMALELGWEESRVARELAEVEARYPDFA